MLNIKVRYVGTLGIETKNGTQYNFYESLQFAIMMARRETIYSYHILLIY